MKDRIIFALIMTADPREVDRDEDGQPTVNSRSENGRVFLATPDGDGWLVESWHETATLKPVQHIDIVPDTDNLAAAIARAVQEIADTDEED